jgi:hypothetical protein
VLPLANGAVPVALAIFLALIALRADNLRVSGHRNPPQKLYLSDAACGKAQLPALSARRRVVIPAKPSKTSADAAL